MGKVQFFLSRTINSRIRKRVRLVTIMHKNLSKWKEENIKSKMMGRRSKMGYVNTETRFMVSTSTRIQNNIEILGSDERRRACRRGSKKTNC